MVFLIYNNILVMNVIFTINIFDKTLQLEVLSKSVFDRLYKLFLENKKHFPIHLFIENLSINYCIDMVDKMFI